ncbi:MAG: VCBS repeat-containing protein [Candidatus Sulfotelmatobacter sp.]
MKRHFVHLLRAVSPRNAGIVVCGAASALMAFMTIAAAASTVQFKPAQNYVVGTNPTSVAVGDFNGDGKPDLVVGNSGSNNVSVLLGNGDGTFQAARNFDAGNSPSIFALADFNGDGKADVAVLASAGTDSPQQVYILMGNGDGTLQAPVVTTLTAEESVIAAADLNGDKKAELVVNLSDANGAAGIEVLLGNGDGTFQTPKTVVTGAESVLTVADFDRDGKPDLAISTSNGAQIMKGQGDGTFSSGGQAALAAGFGAVTAWTADLNGDGNIDLIVKSTASVEGTCGPFHNPCTITEEHVSVFLGSGSGKLGTEQIFATASLCSEWCPFFVTYHGVGDFDGDGKPDIAASQKVQSGMSFALDPGNGDGTFASPIGFPVPAPVNASIVADLNGDQLADVIVLDPANNSIDVLVNVTPAFSMTASANQLTANPGEQVTDTMRFAQDNGFSFTIQLSCQVTGPAPAPTCSLSPASIAGGAGSSTSTLTISVPGASAGLVAPQSRLPLQSLYALALPFAFVGLGFRRKRVVPRHKRWLLGASLATAALISTACGGGNGNTQSGHQPQSYTVQVTAASDALTKAMQISLTVQ